jgi:hypothetical protein
MLHLVRLVLDDRWTADAAAVRLSQTVRDPAVLRHMSFRVRRALDDRPSTIAERAAITLALATDGQPTPGRVDHQHVG